MKNLNKIMMLAAMAFAATACSSDPSDPPEMTGDTQTNCINVSIRMANNSSRAAEFADGEGLESLVKDVVFAFYNAQGVCVASALYTDPTVDNSPTGNVETVYKQQVEFQLPVGAQLPVSMMVYVNPTATNVGSLSLNEVKSALRDTYVTTSGNFTMNNAVYFNSAGVKQVEVATPVGAYYLKGNPPATPQEIDVYVERMAVKTTLAFKDDYDNVKLELTGATEKIQFVPDKWGLTCTEKKMHLIKYFDPSIYTTTFVQDPTSLFSDWNDYANHRSYWANSVTYGRSISEYPDVSDDLLPDAHNDFLIPHATYEDTEPLKYLSYNEIIGNVANPLYCNENTISNFTPSAATSVIIAGHYEYVGGGNVGTFYVRNNNFYTDDTLKVFFLSRIQSYLKYNDAAIEVAGYNAEGNLVLINSALFDEIKNDFEFVHPTYSLTSGIATTKNTERLVTLNLKSSSISSYKFTDGSTDVQVTAANLNDVNKEIYARASVAEAFTDGKAVFFWALRHLNSTPGGIGHYGAVRNHWYQVTVNKIANLGIGVFDPDAPLVPHEDETEFGIDANVNILAWRTVYNNADL